MDTNSQSGRRGGRDEHTAVAILVLGNDCWWSRMSKDSQDDVSERLVKRLLTPVAKFWNCRRVSSVTEEVIQSIGGNAYIEDTPPPLLPGGAAQRDLGGHLEHDGDGRRSRPHA